MTENDYIKYGNNHLLDIKIKRIYRTSVIFSLLLFVFTGGNLFESPKNNLHISIQYSYPRNAHLSFFFLPLRMHMSVKVVLTNLYYLNRMCTAAPGQLLRAHVCVFVVDFIKMKTKLKVHRQHIEFEKAHDIVFNVVAGITLLRHNTYLIIYVYIIVSVKVRQYFWCMININITLKN